MKVTSLWSIKSALIALVGVTISALLIVVGADRVDDGEANIATTTTTTTAATTSAPSDSTSVGDEPASVDPISCAGSAEIPNTSELVVSDSDPTLSHDGHPHGVPSDFSWYSHPTRNDLATTPAETLGQFHAIIGWGQLYEEADGSPATNTRVQVRALQTWYRLRPSAPDGDRAEDWILASPGIVDHPDAAWYEESFANDFNQPSDAETVASGSGGGLTATAGEGHVFHFYPSSRHAVDLTDVEAVFTTVEARLIVADPNGPEDCDRARFIMNVGTDVYEGVAGSVETAPAIDEGRFRYVTKDWQWFNVAQFPGNNDMGYLDAHPLPLNQR